MERIGDEIASDYQWHKRVVLIVSLAFSIVIGPLLIIVEENSPAEDLLSFLIWISSSILMATWCHIDNRQRQHLASRWPKHGIPRVFRALIVLFGVLALFYYLIVSRGAKQGIIAIFKATGLILGNFLVAMVSAGVFAYVFDVPIPE